MAIGITEHTYKEFIETKQTAEKVGEFSILWGFLRVPNLIYHEETIHKGVCERCYQEEFTDIHGYHQIDRDIRSLRNLKK